MSAIFWGFLDLKAGVGVIDIGTILAVIGAGTAVVRMNKSSKRDLELRFKEMDEDKVDNTLFKQHEKHDEELHEAMTKSIKRVEKGVDLLVEHHLKNNK